MVTALLRATGRIAGLAAICCGAWPMVLSAQQGTGGFDSLYVQDYSHILTGRTYISTKDNAFSIRASGGSNNLIYNPNNRINLGLGASYRSLTLNIGLPIPGLNDRDDVFGLTRYFDAQANIHTKRTATNLFLQLFTGYHLRSHTLEETNWPPLAQKPYRPDAFQFNFGFSSLRVVNNDRFSYRASFNQDAWQKRSQGSWLFGGYATFFGLRADSSLVPTALNADFAASARISRADLFDAGAMGGYVHTFVYKGHWFATFSAVVGAGLSLQNTVYTGTDGTDKLIRAGGRTGLAHTGPRRCRVQQHTALRRHFVQPGTVGPFAGRGAALHLERVQHPLQRGAPVQHPHPLHGPRHPVVPAQCARTHRGHASR
ncbi:MAG: DUF4421 family protein [Flavobacteriales bacterium]